MKRDDTKLLIEMMQILLNGGSFSVKALGKKYDTPERTIRSKIQNNIQPLFPEIIVYDPSTERWRAKEDLREKTILSAKELVSLQMMKNHVSNFSDEIIQDANKLLNKFQQGVFSNEVFKNTRKEKLDIEHQEMMTLLLNAIRQKKRVSCLYSNKQRVIEPLKIVTLEGYWYLYLFNIVKETGKKESKKFHLKSMKNICILNENFEYPKISFFKKFNTSINAYFDLSKEHETVELLIHKDIVKYFKRIPLSSTQWIDDTIINEYQTCRIEVTNIEEILPTIQQYLPKIKVLHPLELEKQISENIKNYKK